MHAWTKLTSMLLVAAAAATAAHAQDEPDPYFIDANSDGIDGVLTGAIFVAPPPTGVDGATRGTTPADPVATIGFGINRAVSTGRSQVLVQIGTYNESLTLFPGISIYGGYGAGFARVASTASVGTVVQGGATAVLAENISSATTLSFLTLRSGNATSPADSSYAVRIVNSSGPLTLRYNRIAPGNGFSGFGGGSGAPGLPILTAPAAGVNADQSSSSSPHVGGPGGTSSCGASGGKGGNGGVGNTIAPQVGVAGNGGAGSGPAGVNSSSAANDGTDGGAGGIGQPGVTGTHGAPSPNAVGSIDGSGLYVPPIGSYGEAGSDGAGGGGGGGGGGQNCSVGCMPDRGASGGGGGAGGCAGAGANSGRSGGGSFGILVDASSNALITANLFTLGLGGAGGDGGNGGIGSNGSTGAPGGLKNGTDGGNGGSGGDGSKGGDGGSGAGGNGGPAIGVLDPADNAIAAGNRYQQAASAAAVGFNGNNNSATPTPGVRAFKFPDAVATLGLPAASINDITAGEPGAGSANAVFTVSLSVVSDSVVSINYTLNGTGGATPGVDFNNTAGTVIFNPWTTLATIPVPILADAEVEGPEQFQLVLTPPVGLGNFTIADGTGVGTIVTDAVFQNGFE